MDGTASREPKLNNINNAINRIENAVENLYSTADKVRGNSIDQPKDIGIKSQIPSLADFLETGASRLNSIEERISKVTEELEQLLF